LAWQCDNFIKDRECSVADPDPEPDPEGSETFGRIQIRSETEKNLLDPDSIPDPKTGFESGSEKIRKNLYKGAVHSGQNKVVSYDYTYFTFSVQGII
jgi:hypothetical protein